MASVQTESLFLEHLRQSRLVAEEVVERLKEQHPEIADDTTWAKTFIAAKALNIFQASRILQGHWQDLLFGDYYAVHVLHVGGIGKVYLARRRNDPRWFVVKVLQEQFRNDAGLKDHFHLEAHALINLRHPHLVQGIEFSNQDSNRPYLVMEFVEGPNLREWVTIRGPLALGQAADIIAQAAAGLQHAHDHQFLHRDIKPANIVLAASGIAKVLDFGLAKYVGNDPRWENIVDRKPGTPDFVAPERVIPNSPIDHRADIYSLGCAFYYILAGKAPFAEGTARDKVRAHVRQPPTPIAQVRPGLPAELASIVHKMIAKRPADRFNTMAEVAAALQPFAVRTPVEVNLRALLQARFKTQVTPPPTMPVAPSTAAESPVVHQPELIETDNAAAAITPAIVPVAEETLSPLVKLETAVHTITDELQQERAENARLLRELDELQTVSQTETSRLQAKVQELAQRLLTLQDANDRLQHERDEAVRAAATTQVRVHELETTLQTYREQVTGLTTRTEQLAAEVNVLQQGLRNQESQYAELRSAYEQAGQQSARPLDDAELFDEVLGDEDLLRDLTRRDSAW